MEKISEPIICSVRTKNSDEINSSDQISDHSGKAVLKHRKAVGVKNLLYKSISYKKIKLPYRFTLISCEIIYKTQHIFTIRLSGFFLSEINIPSGEPKLSLFKTKDPPISSLDDNGMLIVKPLSDKSIGNTYFIAHWLNDSLHIFWSLKENDAILRNPSQYPYRNWNILEL